MSLLEVKNLKVAFTSQTGIINAVEGVDLSVDEGESVAIVGESGCGKSVTGMSVMKLLQPPANIRADSITFTKASGDKQCVKDILNATEQDMLKIRGKDISMIFQDPSAALNPVMRVGLQIDEVYRYHLGLNQRQAREKTIALLEGIGISAARRRYNQFPHELSGGIRQRILIAIATACMPKLMIADEPTTALDVTIQAQIMELLGELVSKNKMALILITHDLGLVASTASRVYVMYCGKIMEHGNVKDVLNRPLHPYTAGLINSLPDIDIKLSRFEQIPLSVPHPAHKPKGCYFHPRCKFAGEICRELMPPLKNAGEGRQVRCWLWEGKN